MKHYDNYDYESAFNQQADKLKEEAEKAIQKIEAE